MPKRSTLDWILEASALSALLATFAIILANYNELPNRVPTHFNAAGTPDNWGLKTGVWVLPCVGLTLYLMLTILENFPHKFNVPFAVDRNSPQVLSLLRQTVIATKTVMLLIFASITWITIQTALGAQSGLGPFFLPVTILGVVGVLTWFVFRLHRYQV